MLNIQILTQNNQQTIEKCIESIERIKGVINVIDLNSTDGTIDILKKYKKINLKIEKNDIFNLSELRNYNLKEGFNFWINPWEELITGHQEINNINNVDCVSFKILNKKNIFFENRIFIYPKLKFNNYIFENIYSDSVIIDNVLIKQLDHSLNYKNILKNLNYWKSEDPLSKKPYYYECYLHLNNKDYSRFVELSKNYLNNVIQEDNSSVILRYNLAFVQSLNKNSIKESIENIIICIINEPSISEFWCLLGDIHYKLGLTHKAISFYENAIIVKDKRINNFPIEIEKLKKHPQNMIEFCNNLISKIQQ